MEPVGEVTNRINPPPVDSASQVKVVGINATVWTSVDGVVTVRLTGIASYAGRTASYAIEVEPTLEIIDSIQRIMNRYATQIHQGAIAAASEAFGVAKANGEL